MIERGRVPAACCCRDRELMTQGEHLRFQVGSGSDAGANRAEEGNQDRSDPRTTVSAEARSTAAKVSNLW